MGLCLRAPAATTAKRMSSSQTPMVPWSEKYAMATASLISFVSRTRSPLDILTKESSATMAGENQLARQALSNSTWKGTLSGRTQSIRWQRSMPWRSMKPAASTFTRIPRSLSCGYRSRMAVPSAILKSAVPVGCSSHKILSGWSSTAVIIGAINSMHFASVNPVRNGGQCRRPVEKKSTGLWWAGARRWSWWRAIPAGCCSWIGLEGESAPQRMRRWNRRIEQEIVKYELWKQNWEKKKVTDNDRICLKWIRCFSFLHQKGTIRSARDRDRDRLEGNTDFDIDEIGQLFDTKEKLSHTSLYRCWNHVRQMLERFLLGIQNDWLDLSVDRLFLGFGPGIIFLDEICDMWSAVSQEVCPFKGRTQRIYSLESWELHKEMEVWNMKMSFLTMSIFSVLIVWQRTYQRFWDESSLTDSSDWREEIIVKWKCGILRRFDIWHGFVKHEVKNTAAWRWISKGLNSPFADSCHSIPATVYFVHYWFIHNQYEQNQIEETDSYLLEIENGNDRFDRTGGDSLSGVGFGDGDGNGNGNSNSNSNDDGDGDGDGDSDGTTIDFWFLIFDLWSLHRISLIAWFLVHMYDGYPHSTF